jgi:TolB-like protein
VPGPDIFLSYNREDQAVAKRFAEEFEAAGMSVWWDVTLRSGEAYDTVTEDALRSARAVVVLWSPRSVASRWVRAEATLADRNRTLLPARIEACELPIMFELTQTADLAHWQGDVSNPVWLAFLADVRRAVGATGEPVQPVNSAAKRPERGKRPSMAVLPFINRSGQAEDDIFADGMVEDLTVALSVSRRMKVIAASATAVYKRGARDLRQIGRDLGVRYLLEGNVRRVGADLRVTAQLVEAEDGDIVWTQKFDRPLIELSALQEDLVAEVATNLGVEVQRAEMEHALRKPGDISAWEAVLRAEANISTQTLVGSETGILEARRAIAIDPEYDVAHATLAIALSLRYIQRGGKDSDQLQEILEAVDHARGLQSRDPIVLSRIGVALSIAGKFDEGVPFIERAVMLNPNLETPHIAMGQILARQGLLEEAIAEYDVVDRLAPNGIWNHASGIWRSVAHLKAGRLVEALEAVNQTIRNVPSVMAQTQKIVCLLALERDTETRLAIHRLRHSTPDVSWDAVENFLLIGPCQGIAADRRDQLISRVREAWDDAQTPKQVEEL